MVPTVLESLAIEQGVDLVMLCDVQKRLKNIQKALRVLMEIETVPFETAHEQAVYMVDNAIVRANRLALKVAYPNSVTLELFER